MSSFSNLLSSLGNNSQAPQPAASNASRPTVPSQPDRRPNGVPDRFKLTPNNAVAGVKRRSEEPESTPKPKAIKTERNGLPNRPVAPSSGRFQLSAKGNAATPSSPAGQRPAIVSTLAANPARPLAKQIPRQGAAATPTPPGTANGSAQPKKGFASLLEKAKAAEAAAKASNGGGIKHKSVEKLSKRDRMKLREEALAQQKAGRKGQLLSDRSRSGTPAGPAATGSIAGKQKVQAQETSYKGTMKKPAPEPLSYKGTMKPAGSGAPRAPPQKGMAQDKYGGYASWSDLDDAEEDEDEGGYDDSDDDMEAGIDDLEAEESAALRAARKEDQEALEEEERLKREKLERKRRLMQLSKSAAAKKKF